jgi:hypothetical protein
MLKGLPRHQPKEDAMPRKPRQRSGSGRPDTAPLAEIRPDAAEPVQPRWIAEQFPAYVGEPDMAGELSSVRGFDFRGHDVRITTTYRVEIDGHPVHLHALVDDQGNLLCHTFPYRRYRSAVELVRELLERFPEFYLDQAGHGGHEDHGHEHGAEAHER